ncbi:hypothetical protein C806_00127 [Lachnospiraceae bacterium 3-1]|nr:hypothetical protein C806_00127 [Lachnospiraceae bacterium 3-1]
MAVKSKALEKPEGAKFGKSERTENLFTKEQLLNSERFQNRKDIINALLESDKHYTVKQTEQMIENYMKGKVK